jgi:hypothetical protein
MKTSVFCLLGLCLTTLWGYTSVPLPTYETHTPLPLYHNVNRTEFFTPLQAATTRAFFAAHTLETYILGEYIFSREDLFTPRRTRFLFRDSIQYQDLSLDALIRLDNLATDSQYDNFDAGWIHPRETMSMIYDLERIYMEYSGGDVLTLGAGKRKYNWGPLELGGLLLSDYNEGFFSIYQKYTAGPFSLRGMTAQLDSYIPDNSPESSLADSRRVHRFVSAARLQYENDRLTAGLGQSTLYAGEGRSFEPQFLFPFIPFHYAKMSSWRYDNHGNNSLGSADLSLFLLEKKLEIYGEILIDDLQQRKTDVSKTIQNHMGYMGGMRFFDIHDFYGFSEAGTITSFTYNHRSLPLRYLQGRGNIGSPLGPDTKLFWGKLGRHITEEISLDLNWWLRQSGERDMSFEHTMDDVHGSIDDPIPYGIIQEETLFWLGASWEKKFFRLFLSGGFLDYKNYQNKKNTTRSTAFFSLGLESGIGFSWKKE